MDKERECRSSLGIKAEKAEALFKAYCMANTMPQMAKMAAEIIGMPLHITDRSYRLITQVNVDMPMKEDKVWQETAELGYLSSSIISGVVRNHKEKKPLRPGEYIRFVWSSEISTYPMLVYYLYNNGILYGHISALCIHGEPDSLDYYLMDYLCDLIAKHLSLGTQEQNQGEKPKESILIDLIETNLQDKQVLINRALATGLNNYSSFLVINAILEQNPVVFRERLKEIFPYGLSLYYEGQLVILLPFSKPTERLTDGEWDSLERLTEEMNAWVCISDAFSSISDFGSYYRKNQRILNLSERYRKALFEDRIFHIMKAFEKRIYRYDRLKSIDLLSQSVLNKNEDIMDYASNNVRKIYDYDKENGTNLLQTLMVFIETQKSFVSTAEQLVTHKNTIRYRVEKLKQILDDDFEDGGILSRLHMHCVILQLHEILA